MSSLLPAPATSPPAVRLAEVFLAFLGLGLTSFGGPVAHLGYFRTAFVVRRQWLDETEYADLVALCQFLPGPASSQVGMAIGHMRAGVAGALAAWVGFTLPSVVLLYAVTLGVRLWRGPVLEGALHGLKLAALAVVAQAVWLMARRLTPDWARRIGALIAAALLLLVPFAQMPVVVIAAAALVGALARRPTAVRPTAIRPTAIAAANPPGKPHPAALGALVAFAGLLLILPLAAHLSGLGMLDVVDRFYRTGALVFGGGHVVLPLLQNELVTPGLIDRDVFLAGYGAAQAVPGPLFSFAFYAGALLRSPPNGISGGLLALSAIYLPSFLLVLGGLPYWQRWKTIPQLRAALDAANAAVVGILLAALITPVFTSAVASVLDVAIALLALAALAFRAPPWVVVIICAIAGLAIGSM